jgi:hypothetical protein
MAARTLAQPFPIVTPDTDAMDAARKLAAEGLPGLIVCHDDGRPYTILPGSEVLRFLIPNYVQDDPAPAVLRVRVRFLSARACRTSPMPSSKDAWPTRHKATRHKEGMPR